MNELYLRRKELSNRKKRRDEEAGIGGFDRGEIEEWLDDMGERRLALVDESGIDVQVSFRTTPALHNLRTARERESSRADQGSDGRNSSGADKRGLTSEPTRVHPSNVRRNLRDQI